jgi:monoamine oxidase
MRNDCDVVIVGAGAAGISAARRLAREKADVILLEASSRVGGRAWTTDVDGYLLDLGCGWFHSADRNPWVAIAEASGLQVDRREAAWSTQYKDIGFSAGEQKEAGRALQEWLQRLPIVASLSDCAGEALPPNGAWNDYIDAICGFSNGASIYDMSATDYLAYDGSCTYKNWRVQSGYGALVSRSCPVEADLRLSTPATRIFSEGSRLCIETPKGNIRAKTAILTVSTNVLARGTISLPPDLDEWCDAASRLPMGNDEKLFLRIDDATKFACETHLFGDPHSTKTCDFYVRPFGWPVIECFLGGETAKIVSEDGVEAAFSMAVEQLTTLLGTAAASCVKPMAASNWSNNNFIGGAYSYALPGQSAARRQLARDWNGQIFFAGEATDPADFSTAHGAFNSGVRAAEKALAVIKQGRDG